MSELREALASANVSALIQKQIDPLLLEYQRRYSPLVAMTPTKQWGSNAYYFNQRTVQHTEGSGFVTDGGAVSVGTGTYVQSNFPIKLMQSVGSVTGFAQAVTRDLIGDLKAEEIRGAVQALLWDIETGMIWGNASATTSGQYPQFDGLDAQINTFSGSTQNAIDEGEAAFSLSMLDNLIDLVEENAAMPTTGSDWMLVMSPKANSKLAALQVANQRYTAVDVPIGLNVQSYRDLPIIKSSFLSARSQTTVVTSVTSSSAGGAIASSNATQFYGVSAVVNKFGEVAVSTASSAAFTSGSAGANSVVISVPAQTTFETGVVQLYKVYMGAAASSMTLLGVVDAYDTTGAAVTTIVDTGTNLLTNTSANTGPSAYVGKNAGAKPRSTTDEDVYLLSRDPNFIVRPYVRDIQVINLAPTTSAPDTLPFALVSDTTYAIRAPKYAARLARIVASI